jgi:predicted phosphoribosyltransferase
MRFRDRIDAGRQLAKCLGARRRERPVVLGLPRGGVPVAYEVARALEAPLDVLVARKLGAPRQKELAIGAVAEGGGSYINTDLVERLRVPDSYLEEIERSELATIERRVAMYRGNRPRIDVRGRTAILVDDGLATGATMLAAVRALRKEEPLEIVLGVPVCSPETADTLRAEVDEVVCAKSPAGFEAVGDWYVRFDQTQDDEVIDLLDRSMTA